jgi:hypothetical protein
MHKSRLSTHFVGIVIILTLAIGCTATNTATPAGNITVTYSADKQCSVEGPNSLQYGENSVDMVSNIESQGNVGLALVSLDAGKTIKDLQDWPAVVAPSWVTEVNFFEAPSDGATHTFSFDISSESITGPLYFVCFSSLPATKIGALGPYELKVVSSQ